MRIITGATGLIGKRLVHHWLAQQHPITVIGRTEKHISEVFGNKVKALTWDNVNADAIRNAEIVVNLAGANIAAKRWTDARKQEILQSRIENTFKIAELLAQIGPSAPPLFNASAVGVYGLQKENLDLPRSRRTTNVNGLPPALDEDTAIDWSHPTDFLSQIGREWEQATVPASEKGIRVVKMRFGVVLAKEGGALPMLARPFYFFVGGKMGSGNQPFSWIAIEDLIRAIDFLYARKDQQGAFNFCAPQTVTQKQLAEAIAKVLKRPAITPMPASVLKLMLGSQMAEELLLEGQHVYPKRLLALGFDFKYPTIDTALQHALIEEKKIKEPT